MQPMGTPEDAIKRATERHKAAVDGARERAAELAAERQTGDNGAPEGTSTITASPIRP